MPEAKLPCRAVSIGIVRTVVVVKSECSGFRIRCAAFFITMITEHGVSWLALIFTAMHHSP